MELKGTYTFDAPRDLVWKALLDPEVLAKVMPGCQKLEKVGDNQYTGALKIKVGPVQGVFQGAVTLSDLNAPESYQMQVDGRGGPGFMKGQGSVQLESQGDKTLMHYGGEAQVGGRIASIGQRLLNSSAKSITRQSLNSLNKQIQARLQAQASSETREQEESKAEAVDDPSPETPAQSPSQQQPQVEMPESPSQTEFAANVTKDILDDLIPSEQRPKLIALAMGVLFVIFLLNSLGQRRNDHLARRIADILDKREYRRV